MFDGSGLEWLVRLDRVAAAAKQGGTAGVVVGERRPRVEAGVAITLCVAVLKADRFEFVLQRCTEAGVARFQPFVSRRCVAEMPRGAKLARWQRIVREAAEQSGRVVVPPLLPVIDLVAVPRDPHLTPAIVLWEDERSVGLRTALDRLAELRPASPAPSPHPSTSPWPAKLSLIVGPEGGLEAGEVEMLASNGIQKASIGPRVLRAETAALAGAVAALYHLGQLDRP